MNIGQTALNIHEKLPALLTLELRFHFLLCYTICFLTMTLFSCPVLFSIFVPFSRDAKGMEIGELLEVVHPSLLAATVYVTDSHLSCLHRMCPQG